MSKAATLQGLNPLVTRPQAQARSLCAQLITQGAACTLFPTLEIEPFAKLPDFQAKLNNLELVDIAIFLSKNAVANVMALWPASQFRQIASIGPATRDALQEAGVTVDLMPENDFTSEGLLSLPALFGVRGKRIVIFSGVGGRNVITDSLTERGALVSKVECYRRIQPQYDMAAVWQQWLQADINLIISYSGESLHNLYAMVGEQHRAWLLDCPLLVISQRLHKIAQELGFNHVLQASDASDTAMINALIDWYAR